jgi:TolB-like protein/DNA-binding winged helix-turn-helix (wHTH) protein/Flp pilus assembly protein TadD
MQILSHEIRSFDGFTLDLTRGCLLRGSQEVKLRPKPFEALKYLVENPGRLISKTELIEVIWPDTAVTDDSLVQCLIEVRRALGDYAQQVIKTVPRRGYIFDRPVSETAPIAPITTVTEESGVHLIIEEEETNSHGLLDTRALPTETLTLPTYQPVRIQRIATAIKQHKWVATISLLAFAAAFAGIVWLTRPAEAIDSVAVLPFVNVNGDPNTDYLAEGISDNILYRLSHVPNLKKVIALNSVLRYKGKQPDPQTVGHELGVRAVLMGRITQNGDEVSITTELIDVRDNRRIWGEQYKRKLSDLASWQMNLPDQISEQLALRLTGLDQKQQNKPDSKNVEAQQLYLKGRYFWNKGTRETIDKAVGFYQQAIYKDPSYAAAYSGLADCYIALASRFGFPAEEGFANAEAAARKALELDETLAEAHTSLAAVKESHWDWPGAEKEYKRAIELNPNYALAHAWYADTLSITERHQAAIAEVKRGQELDPFSQRINANVGLVLHFARRDDEAIADLKKTLEMDATYPWTHRNLGLCYLEKKMFSEGIAEFQKVRELSHGDLGGIILGYAYALAGRRDEAIKVIDQIKERKGNASAVAMIYVGLADKDKALEWLEKAYQEHERLPFALKADPMWDPIRSEPRFIELTRRMKLAA